MPTRRIASVNQFSCYGGGGIASLSSDFSLQSHEPQSTRSAPAGRPVRRCLSFDQVQSTPGRGYARSVGANPCPPGPPLARSMGANPCPPGPPLATSSRAGSRGRPADATFTIDRPGAGPFALDETFEAGPFALNETFTIEDPEHWPPDPRLNERFCLGPGENLEEMTARFDNRRYENLRQMHRLEPREEGVLSTPGVHTVGQVGRHTRSSPGAGYAHLTPRTPIPPGFVRPPQPCPPDSPGSSWSSGYDSSKYSSSSPSSSDRPAPGFHPHLGQQYPPQQRPGQKGVSYFLPVDQSPPRQQPPVPQQPRQPVPPGVSWFIPWNSPEPLIPGLPRPQTPSPRPGTTAAQLQERHLSPQPGPSGLQRPVRAVDQTPHGRPGDDQQLRRRPLRPPEDLNSAGDRILWSEFGIPPKPPPGLQRQFPTPEGTEAVRPIMEGILRMVEFGFETLHERAHRVQEMQRHMVSMQGRQEEVLESLRELRRLAIENIEGYLRQATTKWNNLGELYFDTVGMADTLREGPWPRLHGLQETEVVSQDQYSELVRRAAFLARAINRELCSDTTLLRQLINTFENIEGDLNRCQNFLPNFFKYIDWASQRTETLQRFLSYSQGEFDRFITAWQGIDRPFEQPLTEAEYEEALLPLERLQDPTQGSVSVSTESPTPPTSPRRGSWSPTVSPRGMTNVLPRTPPDLPVRVQQWMREASPSQGIPQEMPRTTPYYLRSLFEDYNQMEVRAVNEVQNSSDENHSLNEGVNAMNQSHSSSD